MLTDVHAHLTHAVFADDLDQVLERAALASVSTVVVNGLEPRSNRRVLELSRQHPGIAAALGIYPLDAAARMLSTHPWPFDFREPEVFDIDEEIAFIEAHASEIVAIGECGLDGHWVPESLPAQVAVLEQLCALSLKLDLPLILHSRRAEEKTFQVIQSCGVKRAVFHCFMGRKKLAQEIAAAGYYLSIPPIVERTESFQVIVRTVAPEQLLLETDSPYLSADRGGRNEPAAARRSADWIQQCWGLDRDACHERLAANTRAALGTSTVGKG